MRALKLLLAMGALCVLGMPASAFGAEVRSWTAPFALAGPAGGAGAPQVGIDEQGESAAIWSIDYGAGAAVVRRAVAPQIVSSTDVVQVALRPAGGSYGAIQTLSDASASAYSASVGIAAGGEAIAVWTQDQAGEKTRGEKSEVECSVRPAGGAFGPAQVLSTPGVQAEQPSLAVNSAGEAIVSWLGEEDTKLEYAMRSGKAFGSPRSIDPKPLAGIDDVHGALDARGDAILAWDEEEEPSAGVYLGRVVAAQAPAPATFGSPIALSEPGAHDFLPTVALDAQGEATLVWVQDAEDVTTKKATYRVLARTLSSAGASGMLQTLSEVGQNPEDPNVGVDGAGEATAAWTRSTSSSSKFEAAVLPAGSGVFDPPSALDESAGGFIESAVAVDEGGEAMAMWSHETAEGEQVEEAERAAGGSFSVPVAVSSPAPGLVDPSVAIDAAGDAAAAWDAFGHESLFVQASNFVLPTPPAPAPPAGGASAGTSSGTTSQTGQAGTTAPLLVSLHASKPKLAKLLKKGSLEVACTLSAPGSCRIELVLPAKVARKLGLRVGRHAKTIAIGSASIAFATAGTETGVLKLSSSALRALRGAHRPLAASITASARGSSGASATARPIALQLR